MRLHRPVNNASTRAGAAPQISDLRRSSLALGQTSFAKGKAALIAVLLALLCFILAGCSATPIQDEMSFEAPGKQIPIRIIAGDTIIDAVLYENGTAQSFAKLLPLTADLWTPMRWLMSAFLKRSTCSMTGSSNFTWHFCIRFSLTASIH